MRNFLINSAFSLAIGLTGFPFWPGPLQRSNSNSASAATAHKLRMREACDPDLEYCYESRDYVDRPVMRGCTQGRALNKAERMGIRRARIVDVDRRTIEVRGRARDGERVYVTFSRQRGCPVLDY